MLNPHEYSQLIAGEHETFVRFIKNDDGTIVDNETGDQFTIMEVDEALRKKSTMAVFGWEMLSGQDLLRMVQKVPEFNKAIHSIGFKTGASIAGFKKSTNPAI